MPESLNIIVGHPSPSAIAEIRSVVEIRHSVIAEPTTTARLRESAMAMWPDLLITAIQYPDGSGLDTLIELGSIKPLPAVVVTPKKSLDLVEKAMQDHVMAFLIEPVQAEELHAAILLARGRFDQLTELAAEVEDLKQALADRKIIERAKGIIMARDGLSEAEAFVKLRTLAQNSRMRLTEAANRVLSTHA